MREKKNARPSNRILMDQQTPKYRVRKDARLTFGALIEHLKQKGLTMFRTNEAGYGCQTWTAAVVASLTEAGYIEGGDYASKSEAYLKLVTQGLKYEGSATDRPDETGAFFGYEAEYYMPASKENAEKKYAEDHTAYKAQKELQKEIKKLEGKLINAEKAARKSKK